MRYTIKLNIIIFVCQNVPIASLKREREREREKDKFINDAGMGAAC